MVSSHYANLKAQFRGDVLDLFEKKGFQPENVRFRWEI